MKTKKTALALGQKLFDDAGNYRNLLYMSGFQNEAKIINEAMILIEKAGGGN